MHVSDVLYLKNENFTCTAKKNDANRKIYQKSIRKWMLWKKWKFVSHTSGSIVFTLGAGPKVYLFRPQMGLKRGFFWAQKWYRKMTCPKCWSLLQMHVKIFLGCKKIEIIHYCNPWIISSAEHRRPPLTHSFLNKVPQNDRQFSSKRIHCTFLQH